MICFRPQNYYGECEISAALKLEFRLIPSTLATCLQSPK